MCTEAQGLRAQTVKEILIQIPNVQLLADDLKYDLRQAGADQTKILQLNQVEVEVQVDMSNRKRQIAGLALEIKKQHGVIDTMSRYHKQDIKRQDIVIRSKTQLVDELAAANRDLDANVERLKSKLGLKDSLVTQLRADNASLERDLKFKDVKLRDLNTDRDSTVAQLKSEIVKCERDLGAKDSKARDLEAKENSLLIHLRDKIDSLEQDLKCKDTELRDLNANDGSTIIYLRANVAGLESELRLKDNAIQSNFFPPQLSLF